MRAENARGPLAFLVAFVMVVLLGSFPNARGTIVQVCVLVLLAIALSELTSRALPRPDRRQWLLDGPLRESAEVAHRPKDLVELEHALAWRSYEPREFRNRVRPVLRDLMIARIGAGIVPPSLMRVVEDDLEGVERVHTSDIERLVDEIEALQ
ncbi:MAG: hypothetical protein ACRDKT_15480 [Actinomycetota bacterium]